MRRQSTRIRQLKFARNAPTGPIHINLEDDAEENIENNEVVKYNNAAEELISTGDQNVAEAGT